LSRPFSWACRLRAGGRKGSFAAAGGYDLVGSYNCQPRPCSLCSSRRADTGPRKVRKIRKTEVDRPAIERIMKREDIDALKENVGCGAVLESAGFAIDIKESTRRALKYRRGSEIIIVTHEGRGWFDPLGEGKGDVFLLVAHLDRVDFVEALERVASLIGFQPSPSTCRPNPSSQILSVNLADRWNARRQPWRGSATWRYLTGERLLPSSILKAVIDHDSLREGPKGSMWAAHRDEAQKILGWETRGPEWRGFATGGAKVLFRLGVLEGSRLCVTEAAIDAMSLAAIEGLRDGTLYLSTGGGWSPTTEAALRLLACRPGVQLVAATDANPQGERFAERLREVAADVGCDWSRLRPPIEDWNETLKAREKEKRERRQRGVPHSRHPRQGKLRPDKPALDPAGRDVGGSEGVMKD